MYKVVISSLFFFSYRNKVISFKLWTIWGRPFITAPPIKRGGGSRSGDVRWRGRGWGGSDALVTSPVNFSKWISTYFHQQNWVVCKITKIRNFCKNFSSPANRKMTKLLPFCKFVQNVEFSQSFLIVLLFVIGLNVWSMLHIIFCLKTLTIGIVISYPQNIYLEVM